MNTRLKSSLEYKLFRYPLYSIRIRLFSNQLNYCPRSISGFISQNSSLFQDKLKVFDINYFNNLMQRKEKVEDMNILLHMMSDYLHSSRLDPVIIDEFLSQILVSSSQIELKQHEYILRILNIFTTLDLILPFSLKKKIQVELIKDIIDRMLSLKRLNIFTSTMCVQSLYLMKCYNITNTEIEFYLNYSLSKEFSLLKLIKYGRKLFNLNFNKNERIFTKLFITLTNIDMTYVPNVELDNKDIPLLILYCNEIKDLVKLIDIYMEILEQDLDLSPALNITDINLRLDILNKLINFSHLKKEYPQIKLLTDILLGYCREYCSVFNLYQLVKCFNVISKDNFLLSYDVSIFKHLLMDQLNKIDLSESEWDCTVLVELFYYLDKIYSKDEIRTLKCQIISLIRTEHQYLVQLLDVYFNDKDNLDLIVNIKEKYPNLDTIIESIKQLNDKIDLITKLELKILLVENYNQLVHDHIKAKGIFGNLEFTYFLTNQYS